LNWDTQERKFVVPVAMDIWGTFSTMVPLQPGCGFALIQAR